MLRFKHRPCHYLALQPHGDTYEMVGITPVDAGKALRRALRLASTHSKESVTVSYVCVL